MLTQDNTHGSIRIVCDEKEKMDHNNLNVKEPLY